MDQYKNAFLFHKKFLTDYNFIDIYNGYQVIAEIWENSLNHDAEIIANEGFYMAGRSREPHMVTKGSGSNKREEMDGYYGRIIPNDLIASELYSEEIKKDENNLKNEVQERIIRLTDDEIDMLVFKKWFGNTVDEMVDLIKIPLKAEIDVIEMLQERYADTLADIDAEIAELMNEFNELRSELVVE